MIGIRVDANKNIASGHVMRCLSIADALFSLGEEVLFFTSDEMAKDIIQKRGYGVVCLNSDWSDKEGEIDTLLREIRNKPLRGLLVDSYQVTPEYLKALGKTVKLIYLDDLNMFDYPVDIVVNYSICAEEIEYPKNKAYILGPKYAPLRSQFDLEEGQIKRAKRERNINKRILITTGAADLYFVGPKIVEAILNKPEFREYSIIMIKGSYWDDKCVDNYSHVFNASRVTVLSDVVDMANVMLGCSFAVSAGGSTLYELCACRVPTVTFSYADNQLDNVHGFDKRGIMKYAGDAREEKSIEENIVGKLLTYFNNDDIIKDIEDNMEHVNCHYGGKCLAEAILCKI